MYNVWGKENGQRILVGKQKLRTTFIGLCSRWEDNIKLDNRKGKEAGFEYKMCVSNSSTNLSKAFSA